MLRQTIILGVLLVVVACSPFGSPQPTERVDVETEQSIVFRGNRYVTNMRGIALEESKLIPLGTATLEHTGVIDTTVWALPGVNPATGIVLRMPPGFDEPGWNITGFIFFVKKGLSGSPPEVCPYWADPTPGCPNWYSTPKPS